MKPRIYLDFNATAPLVAQARGAIVDAAAVLGNPSSIHEHGRWARDVVERARNHVAALAGAPREQVVFTSGGTEANALGLAMVAAAAQRQGRPRVIASSRIEHPSLQAAVAACGSAGWTVRWLEVTADARVILPQGEPLGVLALGVVNHELGTIAGTATESLAELIQRIRGDGALIHLDAVQAAGKQELGPLVASADTVALSAHKLGGPQGVGALIVGPAAELGAVTASDMEAGHQERGRRPGTENTLGIAGFGAAAAAVDPGAWAAVVALGAELEAGLLELPDVRIHGAGAPRIGGTINAGFGGALGESIVMALDLVGVSVSTGAACTSGSIQPSPVLLGLGLPPTQAREAVRFSLGTSTTVAEVAEVLSLLPGIVERARRHR